MASDTVEPMHQDWAPAFDATAGRWRVARIDAQGVRVFGGTTGLSGDPYGCCCEDRANALANVMNQDGHP